MAFWAIGLASLSLSIFDGLPSLADQPGSDRGSWKVVFKDDFEGRSELGKDYVRKAQSKEGWNIRDGVMVAKQNRPEHGTVLRRELDYSDMKFEFDFRFTEKKQWCNFNVVFDDSKEKSVHSGHISRVSISRNAIKLSDDKLGSMNKEIRDLRKLKDKTQQQEQELAQRLANTSLNTKVKLSDDKWHHAVITVVGSEIRVVLDGEEVGVLDSPGNDHKTRDRYGFTVTGKIPVEFDNLIVSVPADTTSTE